MVTIAYFGAFLGCQLKSTMALKDKIQSILAHTTIISYKVVHTATEVD